MHCLIVEDDQKISAEQAQLLIDMGHTVTVVTTLSAARAELNVRKFDLVLMEYALSDGTTEHLSDRVAASCPNARIIMLTGKPVFPYGEHARQTPSVDWLMRKPVVLNDLQALVSYAAKDANSAPTHTAAPMGLLA